MGVETLWQLAVDLGPVGIIVALIAFFIVFKIATKIFRIALTIGALAVIYYMFFA